MEDDIACVDVADQRVRRMCCALFGDIRGVEIQTNVWAIGYLDPKSFRSPAVIPPSRAHGRYMLCGLTPMARLE